MQRKNESRYERQGAIAEQAPGHREHQANDGGVKQNVDQVEFIRHGPEQLVAEQISERHHGPIIVGDTLDAHV